MQTTNSFSKLSQIDKLHVLRFSQSIHFQRYVARGQHEFSILHPDYRAQSFNKQASVSWCNSRITNTLTITRSSIGAEISDGSLYAGAVPT